MGRAATREELADALDDALQWRRTELHAIKSELDSFTDATVHTPKARAIRRASVALLYAHWEGFVKECCQKYLEFVLKRRLKLSELSDPFVLIAVRPWMVASSKGDPAAAQRILELVRDGPNMRSKSDRSGVVNTRSNLRYGTLVEILDALGLPSDRFELKASLIDRSLCDVRNDIAHGKANCPEPREFAELLAEVLGMMIDVQNAVIVAAFGDHYRA